MTHFEKCSVCPVDPGVDCYAQLTGSAHTYCRRIRAGDAQACALVLSHSTPLADPTPALDPVSPPDSNSGDEAAAVRAAKPRIALGVPQKPPADCIPCQEAAANRST